MSLRNVSYAIGILPAIKIATLVHDRPVIAEVLVGVACLALWVAFVRWVGK